MHRLAFTTHVDKIWVWKLLLDGCLIESGSSSLALSPKNRYLDIYLVTDTTLSLIFPLINVEVPELNAC